MWVFSGRTERIRIGISLPDLGAAAIVRITGNSYIDQRETGP